MAESLNAINRRSRWLRAGPQAAQANDAPPRVRVPATRLHLLYSAVARAVPLQHALYFGFVVFYQTVSQSLLQQHSPAEALGPIMSLYVLGQLGTTPIGGLLTGWITDAVSPRPSLAIGGLTPVLRGVWIATRTRELRTKEV